MADVSSNAIQPWIDRVQISAVIEEWPFWRENPNWEKLRKGTRGEGSPATVSCARHQRHRSERRIKARTGIYDWDRLDPVLPGARLEIDSERLARYPRSYRYLSYFNECNGVSQNLNLPVPGSEGEAVSAGSAFAQAPMVATLANPVAKKEKSVIDIHHLGVRRHDLHQPLDHEFGQPALPRAARSPGTTAA